MMLFLRTAEMRLRRLRQRVRSFVDLAGDKSQSGAVIGRWAMVTLTYAQIGGWSPNHVRRFVNCARLWMEQKGYKLVYVWVAELQQRGAVHYHVLVKLPLGLTLPKPDDRGWWTHGSTRVEWVRRTGKGYMSKYASKETQRHGLFARGLRLCGSGGLPAAARAWARWLLCPCYIRGECEPSDLPRRVQGGFKLADGTYIPSRYTATPMPEFGGVMLQERSLDSWFRAVLDCTPVKTYLARSDAIKRVTAWVEVMWRYGGGHFSNPWARTEVLA